MKTIAPAHPWPARPNSTATETVDVTPRGAMIAMPAVTVCSTPELDSKAVGPAGRCRAPARPRSSDGSPATGAIDSAAAPVPSADGSAPGVANWATACAAASGALAVPEPPGYGAGIGLGISARTGACCGAADPASGTDVDAGDTSEATGGAETPGSGGALGIGVASAGKSIVGCTPLSTGSSDPDGTSSVGASAGSATEPGSPAAGSTSGSAGAGESDAGGAGGAAAGSSGGDDPGAGGSASGGGASSAAAGSVGQAQVSSPDLAVDPPDPDVRLGSAAAAARGVPSMNTPSVTTAASLPTIQTFIVLPRLIRRLRVHELLQTVWAPATRELMTRALADSPRQAAHSRARPILPQGWVGAQRDTLAGALTHRVG